MLAVKEHLGTDGWTDRRIFEEPRPQRGHQWACGQGRGCVAGDLEQGPASESFGSHPGSSLGVLWLKVQLSCSCMRAEVLSPVWVPHLASASVQ